MNNYVPLFPGLDTTKKMTPEELNGVLLNSVPNARSKQIYLQGWDFEIKTYKETCAMFNQMEIAEQVHEGGTPSKTPIRADPNRDSHVRRRTGG